MASRPTGTGSILPKRNLDTRVKKKEVHPWATSNSFEVSSGRSSLLGNLLSGTQHANRLEGFSPNIAEVDWTIEAELRDLSS